MLLVARQTAVGKDAIGPALPREIRGNVEQHLMIFGEVAHRVDTRLVDPELEIEERGFYVGTIRVSKRLSITEPVEHGKQADSVEVRTVKAVFQKVAGSGNCFGGDVLLFAERHGCHRSQDIVGHGGEMFQCFRPARLVGSVWSHAEGNAAAPKLTIGHEWQAIDRPPGHGHGMFAGSTGHRIKQRRSQGQLRRLALSKRQLPSFTVLLHAGHPEPIWLRAGNF